MNANKKSPSQNFPTPDIDLPPEVIHEQEWREIRDKILNSNSMPWEGYQNAGRITHEELELIRRYDKKSEEMKKALFDKEGPAYAELFIRLLTIANKEVNQYALTLIDDILSVNESYAFEFLRLKERKPDYPITVILRFLLTPNESYTTYKVCRILSLLMLKSHPNKEEDVQFIFRWLSEQLKKAGSEDVYIGVSSLQYLLRKNEFRLIFKEEGGLQQLSQLLKSQRSPQATYQIIYCLWLMTYNNDIASNVFDTGMIGRLIENLKQNPKEKVLRITLATLRNLLNKANNDQEMIDAGVVRIIETLANRKWGDEDLIDDINTIRDALLKDIVTLSTFDMYKKEILSGSLEWSPVHKSEKFWRENVTRFEENSFQVLKLLAEILNSSTNPLYLSIACYDIGEFVRFHPRGKIVIQNLRDCKSKIMLLMTNADTEVQKQALLCVQKLMVHNWEYLNR